MALRAFTSDSGWKTRNPTGWIAGVRHNSGIVFVPGGPTYVLVLLLRDLSEVGASVDASADVFQFVLDEVTRASSRTDPAGDPDARPPDVKKSLRRTDRDGTEATYRFFKGVGASNY